MAGNQILNDVRIFIYIVREGSLIKASDVLDIPLPTISRRLMYLEENLGKKLMFRDNRTITLTPYGEMFFESCSDLIFKMDTEISKMKEIGDGMSGVIKISAPRALYYHYIHDRLSAFQNTNPDVTFDITLPSHISARKFGQSDIIITKDTNEFYELTSKPFCETRFVVCAAPGYISEPLRHPSALTRKGIKAIVVSAHEKWNFINKHSATDKIMVEPAPYMHTDEFKLARYFVLGGKGLSIFPFPFVANDIVSSKLEIVEFDEWAPENITHYLLYAHYRDIPVKTKELIKFLTKDGLIKL